MNRALLQRQFLLERTSRGVPEVLEQLVGLQAQAGNAPYVGLWTRLARFQLEDLTRLYTSRRVVRATLMRATQHLVTASDFLGLRPALQPVLDRGFQYSPHRRALEGVDLEAVLAEGRRLLSDGPLSNVELGRRLHARWPEHDARGLGFLVRSLSEPLVTVPPFGTWGVGGEVEFTPAEAWLGRPMGPALSEEDVVLRYLRAFGPASVKDMQTWSGLSGLREVVARLGGRLRMFRDEKGRELFDVPDAPRPDGDTPAPVRFLPEFDNVLLSHTDRSRIISEEHRRRVFTVNGIIRATVLVDGFVRGMWRVEREKTGATLCIEPFARISREDRAALTEEGLRLLSCVAADAPTHDVRFSRVS
ncbi:winged helix DNA-binding domain-containing protein [Myxococcus sp. K15C18031901]|uniref:winged helix DNA-binding domain-containing protein n=1 Tax=Myxococcus dinghuensis TaxID=2906761 RepID=UPI0020A6EA74|nr:winged helix DNA-binding domain-containing protein [Myxococcus dinghuensis]MCP3103804.1 winged helix DNA-binding domain-containing protein [Myxococcus dinghuensis]